MFKKISILSLVLMLSIVACAPAADVVEPAVVDEMEESEDAVMEDSEAPDDATSMDEAEDHSSDDAMEAVAEVSFAADVWPIIEQYALNAHGGKGGIFLENYDDIVKQVVPGEPANSLLYKVLIGDGAPQMPPGNPLPEEKIQVIYDWIEQGAMNN